jgi:5-enolpyruvylshikimate-3-phosphate synthase
LRGQVRLPGDKSISHRALLLGALADGESHVEGFLPSEDCHATLACLRALGIEIVVHDATIQRLTVHGRGLNGLQAPVEPLNCVRSGTTMRLLAGILAGQSFDSVLTGEPQLLRRPMRRITEPLRLMGAAIEDVDGHGPLTIRGRDLHGYDHVLKIASAQVKSALLLAGLYADGVTVVRQPGPARDHTERMLAAMGTDMQVEGLDVSLCPHASKLMPLDIKIPGDISSAAFPLVAALIMPDARVVLKGVGVNPTRAGLLDVLEAMGANLTFRHPRLGRETFGEQWNLGRETFGEQRNLGRETFGEQRNLGRETFGEQRNLGRETFGKREKGLGERGEGLGEVSDRYPWEKGLGEVSDRHPWGEGLGEVSDRYPWGKGLGEISNRHPFEPLADIQVRSSTLAGVEVSGETVVRMIDEFPVLAVAATQARGTTLVRDAAELRVKETDRIATIVEGLQALGAEIAPRPDGFVVQGPTPLRGTVVDSHGDHRMAMALAIAGLVAEGETVIENAVCIRDSFPGFVPMMQALGAVCDYVDT